MTPEQKAAFIMAQSACAMAKIGGMQASNMAAQAANEPLMYGPDDFDKVFEEFLIERRAVMGIFDA